MFAEMKAYLEREDLEGQFGYDDLYADYVNGVYYDATEELKLEVHDDSIFIEPSIQAGRGRVDMYCDNGRSTNSWDFESECDTLLEFAEEADNEEEFKNMIKEFLLNKYESCELEEDEDDEDDDYEGCEEDDEDDD